MLPCAGKGVGYGNDETLALPDVRRESTRTIDNKTLLCTAILIATSTTPLAHTTRRNLVTDTNAIANREVRNLRPTPCNYAHDLMSRNDQTIAFHFAIKSIHVIHVAATNPTVRGGNDEFSLDQARP